MWPRRPKRMTWKAVLSWTRRFDIRCGHINFSMGNLVRKGSPAGALGVLILRTRNRPFLVFFPSFHTFTKDAASIRSDVFRFVFLRSYPSFCLIFHMFSTKCDHFRANSTETKHNFQQFFLFSSNRNVHKTRNIVQFLVFFNFSVFLT